MLPSPAPKYYLLGAILSAVGALVLLLRGRRCGPGTPRPWIPLLVGALVVAAGIGAILVGASLDAQYNAGLNTTGFVYQVSVEMNGSWPVRILLPAPSDPRLYDALNATNGTANLRLNHTATETNVVLTAQGNVSFLVQSEVPTAAVDRTFTRLDSCSVGGYGPECVLVLQVDGLPTGTKVHVTLLAEIGVTCETRTLSLDAWVGAGITQHPVWALSVVC